MLYLLLLLSKPPLLSYGLQAAARLRGGGPIPSFAPEVTQGQEMGAPHQHQRSKRQAPCHGSVSGEQPPLPRQRVLIFHPQTALSAQLVFILQSLLVSLQEKPCRDFFMLLVLGRLFCYWLFLSGFFDLFAGQ